MKRFLCLFLALMLLILSFAACGDDDFSSSDDYSSSDGAIGAAGEATESESVITDSAGTWSSQNESSQPAREESAGSAASTSSTSFVYAFLDGVEYRVPMDEPFRFAPEEYQGVWETMRLVGVNGTSLTAVPEDGEILTFGVPQAWAFTGDIPSDIEELRPGMTVRVGYDGCIMETWPGQIIADYLIVEEYDGGLMKIYRDILEEMLGDDSALNDGTDYFGFDLASAPRLSSREAEALGWLFACAHKKLPVYGTVEELGEQGYIDMENLYWEDGVHFSFKLVEGSFSSDTGFTLECVKWRSGLGAVWWETDLRLKNGTWEQTGLRMTAIS